MEETKYATILLNQQANKYCSPMDLMYSNDPGFCLSPYDYGKYLDYLDEWLDKPRKQDAVIDLPLKSFNTKHIYYIINTGLLAYNNEYISLLTEAVKEKKPLLADYLKDVAYKSRIYSEIEGTLNVENVPTTRKRLKELIEKDFKPESLNDVIIKNMDEGLRFIYSIPEFNKDNLLKLYKILSDGCLKKEDEIKEGNYYRDDDVEVDSYIGCPYRQVEECMESLFSFVRDKLKNGNGLEKIYLPHICHYYIAYIHPYFDYNGRTARMVSLWINLLSNHNMMPPLISEAINQDKKDYYQALRDTRNSRNDFTYFLHYILRTSIKYILCYKDLDNINQSVKNQGELLTETELSYVKKILVSYVGKFSYLDFMKNCQIEISKQGAFKILNKFVDLGILVVVDTPSRNKLFDLNKKIIKYTKLK